MFGQVPTSAAVDVTIPLAMQDQGGDRDGRQKRANIVFQAGPYEVGDVVGATADPYRAGVPGSEPLVGHPARGDDLQACGRAPNFSDGGDDLIELFGSMAPGVTVLP